MTTNNQGNNNQQNQGDRSAEKGTTSITGSQITTAATDNNYLPTGNSAAQGAMPITGSITDGTVDKYAGGPHGTSGQG